MNYSEQIKSPKWQKKRLEVLNAKGFKCENCGTEEKQLYVHHKQYINGKKAWEYPISNFMVLCESCHKKQHDEKPEEFQETLRLLKQINKKSHFNIESINFILECYLEGFNYDDFFLDLANIFDSDNENKILEQIKQMNEIERLEVKVFCLSKEIEELKKVNN